MGVNIPTYNDCVEVHLCVSLGSFHGLLQGCSLGLQPSSKPCKLLLYRYSLQAVQLGLDPFESHCWRIRQALQAWDCYLMLTAWASSLRSADQV